ncbi:MAG: RluA family pseudouridine synthase [Pseudodesulfovibrio sp.]|nr:RluA family pseudouridine synthase [Pseudodesulfovibrio sp.]
MIIKKTYVIPANMSGLRLDRVLEEMESESSLRFRRRLCDEGRVLVDGKVRKPGYKVHQEQQIDVLEGVPNMSFEQLGLSVVKQDGMFGAIFKPCGIHSAIIAGKDIPSVEAVLPELFPDSTPILLNRLDHLTSGLLLVALTAEGEKTYHEQEDAGHIKKFYLATVKGRLDGVVTIKNRLDTDDRKKTRVSDEDDSDVRRWTDVESLVHDHDDDTTTVRCLIMKGARHQIRAHLATVGHPIVGDPIYGDGLEENVLHLHHSRIELPGFSAEVDALF